MKYSSVSSSTGTTSSSADRAAVVAQLAEDAVGGAGRGSSRRSCRHLAPSAVARMRCRNACVEVVGAGRGADRGRGVVGDQVALADEQQPVAAAGLVHDVAGHQHGGAGRRPAARNCCHSSSRSTGSWPTVGSSRISTSGRLDQRAGQRGAGRCPPDSVPTSWSGRVAQPDLGDGRVGVGRGHALVEGGEVARVLAYGQVGVDARAPASGSRPCAAAPPTRPAGRAPSPCPTSTICTPTIARISVVLPLPLGPSRPVTLPRRDGAVQAVQHAAFARVRPRGRGPRSRSPWVPPRSRRNSTIVELNAR